MTRTARRAIHIDCDDCAMRSTAACGDCVVTFITSREPGDAVVIDAEEERALRLLARAGLTSPLRHREVMRGKAVRRTV